SSERPIQITYTTIFRSIRHEDLDIGKIDVEVTVIVDVDEVRIASLFGCRSHRQLLGLETARAIVEVEHVAVLIAEEEVDRAVARSEEHTSELQSRENIV